MSGKKKAYIFSQEQLVIIKNRSGKTSVKGLSEELGINYSTVSTSLKFHRIAFTSYSPRNNTVQAKIIPMNKKYNKKGEALLTDDYLKSISYL